MSRGRQKLRIGCSTLAVVVAMCWLMPAFLSHSSDAQDVAHHLEGPSSQHWFGTDSLGRDLLVRVMEGGQLSISVGIVSGILVLVLGVLVGGIAALAPPILDRTLMRVADFGIMMPSLLLATLTSLAIGRGFFAIVASISIVAWAPAAKYVRLSLRSLL